MYTTNCYWCNKEIELEEYEGGQCPCCGLKYDYDEDNYIVMKSLEKKINELLRDAYKEGFVDSGGSGSEAEEKFVGKKHLKLPRKANPSSKVRKNRHEPSR
ncbi:hypothetical protein [Photobacterium lipolyticum]|uniref:Uncharacterized protein n=1 Tax=Photobacterium lipolyticum TaxID=266810 RepID=A0A2T3MQN8_9GAMM|nr:hypothetical protein [Photobacterium lipolyticum]PSV99437.1 hypothetical protein C9I89_21815 [Photobacterium lipolyticum]